MTPGKDITSRICGEHGRFEQQVKGALELFSLKLEQLAADLKKNSDDTKATKRLLIGILVSIVLAFVGSKATGCM